MKQFNKFLLTVFVSASLALSGCQSNESEATDQTQSTATSSTPVVTDATSTGTRSSGAVETDSETTDTDEADRPHEENAMDFTSYAQNAQNALWDNQWNERLGYLNRDYPARFDDKGHDYWWFAHAIDVLVDAYERTGDELYLDRADKVMRGVYTRNGNSLINNFFDDMDWMGLALLRLYDNTSNEEYLEHAKTLFTDIETAWSPVAGGGLGWNKNKRHFKNTPTNAPAVILAARLFERTGIESYKVWAQRIFEYTHEVLRDPASGYIYDGINDNQDGQLTRNAYTYNHGIYVGAAVEMYRMTGDSRYLDYAEETYQNAMRVYLTPSDILKETGEGDGGLFKGILIRYFTLYYYALPEERTDIKDWILRNAESVAEHSINDGGMISDHWSGPSKEEQHLSSHLSGVKLFEAASKLQNVSHADGAYIAD